MSVEVMRDFRGYFISSTSLTTLVPAKDIRIGWSSTVDNFPCIILQQSAGSDVGYLGYNMATTGSKIRREVMTIQVDIYSRASKHNVDTIADVIVPIMISGGCRKDSDVDMYNDDIDVYRKTQIFSHIRYHDD